MSHSTWIEINQKALEHNVAQYKLWLPKKTSIAPVIKANAYGHGLCQIGTIHDQNPLVSRLCVANSHEALLLRNSNIKKPILILSYVHPYDMQEVIDQNIDISVSDLATINSLHSIALKRQKKVNIHLKIDTGMSRLGIFPHELSTYLNIIKQLPALNLQGIWSHLSSSNKPAIVYQQEKLFEPFLTHHNFEKHMTNSLGALNCKNSYDFARIGLGLYGYLLTNKKFYKKALQPVLSLKTTVFFIKKVPKNAYLGYQRLYKTDSQITIALLSIGYCDGLTPDLIGIGSVIIKGKYAPILSINMNVTTIDITHIPECTVHDIATIIGQDGQASLSAYDWQLLLKRNIRICFAGLEPSIPRIVVNQ
ncbi:alanine racemase [Candidatus Dependentiae bacterium]|nr:alanine racemase [Candidatus Dependentiae bacterium]